MASYRNLPNSERPRFKTMRYTVGMTANQNSPTPSPVETPMCQCEHIDHHERDGHYYLGVHAGSRRAEYVGPICDDCATGHLADYLLP